jgi:hypothetical protein
MVLDFAVGHAFEDLLLEDLRHLGRVDDAERVVANLSLANPAGHPCAGGSGIGCRLCHTGSRATGAQRAPTPCSDQLLLLAK